jgi:septum formation protein
MKFLLASTSPRRINILKQWGFDFQSYSPQYIEKDIKGNPIKTVLANAYGKAKSIQKRHYEEIVLGLDTIIGIDGEIIGKPQNKEHHKSILEKLSEKTHTVTTGFSILFKDEFLIDYVVTRVYFRKITDSEIQDYTFSKEGFDKAGGYAAQGIASSFIEKIEGPLDNVLGIPVFAIREGLYKIYMYKNN